MIQITKEQALIYKKMETGGEDTGPGTPGELCIFKV
jgi:hypothetical protein